MTYDEYGNRYSHTPVSGPVQFYQHNNNHELTEIREGSQAGTLSSKYIYDLNGNLTKRCSGTITDNGTDCTGDDELAIQYDALDRQVQADKTGIPTETYQYDPQGRRIEKNIAGNATRYHYDGNAIYQTIQNDWSNPIARYVHGTGTDRPLLEYSAGQTLAYHQDGSNSVVATTDAQSGALQSSQLFDAWGNQILNTGSGISTYGYTGREPDDTGLIYYRARYYNPEIGRFTQQDPLGFIDGVNRYAYALNSPVNFIDPMGTVSLSTNSVPSTNNQGSYFGNVLDNVQLGLDIVGVGGDFVPVVGNIVAAGADLINAGISAARGDSLGASLSLAAVIPYAGIAATTGKFANKASDVKAFDVGNFDELTSRSAVGDKLDIHHVAQKHPAAQVIDGYDPKTAPSIAVPQNQHRRIPTIKGDFDGNARDLLAKDVKDLRNFTDAPNSAIKELIKLNKETFPDAFKK